MAAAVLLGLGLVIIYHLAPAKPAPTRSNVPQTEPEYFAERTSDCDVDLLAMARSESGPFQRVFPVGANRPRERLRRNVWEHGRYRIRGRFTGKLREFSECASFPEFEVLEFRPWGKVQRCASPGALDATLLLYTEDLAQDRYAPEDFIDGPWPASIDDGTCRLIAACAVDERRQESRHAPDDVIDGEELPSLDGRYCKPTATCADGERRVTACSGDIWCCHLLPADDAPEQ
ncbi:hypothetical protein JRI60_47020 [Archangium violaceum]|uniref:hypothetical protein n=1 Tax=Archangium violaceum TaxID=83451 RepID=UPI0019514730|nr:hypothetical protein [Archangium violaceum]QRN96478.1 hypothetical protein JRI60_47020 [Archangium violaceum]